VPKAIGWSIAFILLTLLLAALLGLGGAVLVSGSWQRGVTWFQTTSGGPVLLQAFATIAATAFFTWLLGVRTLRLTPRDLRWTGHGSSGLGFALGLVGGMATAGVALLLGVLVGHATWVSDAGTPAEYVASALKTVAALAPAALSEELLFRGVPLVILAAAMGRGTALVAVAVAFTLAHLTNPNVTVLGLGNIALAGILLGLAFYSPGGLWTATGLHLGWNALLACLDTPVSGVPFRIPLLDYNAGGPAWLTGGRFGPEGGLAATIALTLAVILARQWAGKDTT
jgi:membrane protease YdiL (CAAX protease family)